MNKTQIFNEIKSVVDLEANSLLQLKERIDDSFFEAVQLLSKSNKVVVSGVGKSGLIGKKISATLSSIGISSVFLHPVEALHGDIGMVQDNDVAILLSKSGGTDELVRFIPYLKMRNAKIISITGNMNSFLARNSDVVLDGSVDKEACPFNLAPTTSTTVALAIGDALAMTLIKTNSLSLEDFSRLHPSGQIGRNITIQVKDVMHREENIPLINEHSSLRDAVIEMSKKNLGCVCIVSETSELRGIITDGDLRRFLTENENMKGVKVIDIMTKQPVKIYEDAYLGEALRVMENRSSQISVLPVVDKSNLIKGVIRIHDIVKTGA